MNLPRRYAWRFCNPAMLLTIAAMSLFGQVNRAIPEGYTPIFNGKDIKGWHISRTNHHGTTGNWHVEDGVLIAEQHPYGQGGLLLTDKKYRNFELYIEVKPDDDSDGGIFLRCTETGSAYQVDLTTHRRTPGAGVGNLFGEDLRVGQSARSASEKAWKVHDWNTMKIRMTGEAPEIALWINDVPMYDVREPRNDSLAGAIAGMIALQMHWNAFTPAAGPRFEGAVMWRPGAVHRFRNIAIKELP